MLKEIWHFFKNPSSLDLEGVSEPLRVKTFFRVYWFCLIMSVISGIFILIIESILINNTGYSIRKNMSLNDENFLNYWGNEFWIFAVIVVPITEEIVFRLPLSNRRFFFMIAIAFSVFYFSRDKITIINLEDFTANRVFLFAASFVSLNYFLKEKYFLKFRKKYFNVLCWGLMALFSWIHIINFLPINLKFFYLYPIYVLPQFFSAVGFSFLMIKYKNIIWSIFLHMLINVTALILTGR